MNSSERLSQLTMFDIHVSEAIPNVSSVPQRSPFRYPGGKTWLIPRVRQWLKSLDDKPSLFIEPFAGGAIAGLTVACEALADRVLLVELDDQVAAVWKTILSEDNEWLAKQILAFDLTRENVLAELGKSRDSTKSKAFQVILKNRTFHGGILAAGSSLMKHGEGGRGLISRWYPTTLARRIRAIGTVRSRIKFIEGDGLNIIRKYSNRKDAAFFIDPPYTAGGKNAGARLYAHYELDHRHLFELVEGIAGASMVTYDYAEEVIRLAEAHRLQTRTVSMKNTHHARMTELIIGPDLTWLD